MNMLKDAMYIESWDQSNDAEGLAFLKARYATAIFLLANYQNYGTRATEDVYAADYFQVRNANKDLLGVFSLSKRGSMCLQFCESIDQASFAVLFADHLHKSGRKLGSMFGSYEAVRFLWDELQVKGFIGKTFADRPELLYQHDRPQDFQRDPECRFLRSADFEAWYPHRVAYFAEVGIPNTFSKDELKKSFEEKCEENHWWGIFEKGKLISFSAVLQAFDIGQVGGVYTLPKYRKRGLSKRVMQTLMHDCYKVHGIGKVVLFTEETNVNAQALYESIGFQKIGDYGLFFADS